MTTNNNLAARAGVSLLQSYALLRDLVERSSDLVAAVDPNFRLMLFNQAFERELGRLYGCQCELNGDLRGVLASWPEDLAKLRRGLSQGLEGNDHAELIELGERGGQRQVYEISFGPLRRGGNAGGAFLIARNVIRHIRAEAEVRRLNVELEARVAERTSSLARVNQWLRERDERLNLALEASSTGTFRRDLDSGLAYWDPNLQRLFGLIPDDRPRTRAEMLELLHPDDRARVEQELSRADAQLSGLEISFRVRHPDGTVRWLHQKSRIYFDANGHPQYVAGACSDITPLKDAEHALQEQAAQVRLIADSMPALVWSLDADGRLEYINRQWTRYSGLNLEQTRALGWEAVMHPDDRSVVLARVREAWKLAQPFEAEVRLRRAHGCYRWHLLRSVPMQDSSGKVLRWFGTAIDIDDQVRNRAMLEQVKAELQRANRELALSLAQLEAIINGMSEGMVLFDAEGNWLTMNPAARRLYGIDNEADVRLPRRELAPNMDVRDMNGEPLPYEDWPVSRALRGESFSDYEIRLRRLDGSEWIASCGGAPVYAAGGELVYAMITMHDVTAYHKVQHQLQAALESRDRFLSVASHELRTPLTTLTMQLQMARRRLDPSSPRPMTQAELARVFEVADRQVSRLARLVDDLLDVSRSEGGKLAFDFQPVNLARLAEEVCGQYAASLEGAGCRLRLQLDHRVEGRWDPARLEQALSNLLTNAIKYAPGTAVTVTVARHGTCAHLVVRDGGPGIAPEHRERIFERFERCNTDRAIGGLGLGLFLVKQIVAGHGGDVRVDSELGRGTAFTLVLPLASDTAAAAEPTAWIEMDG